MLNIYKNTYDNNRLSFFLVFIKAYFSTWALMRIGNIHSMNFMGVILFLPIGYFFLQNHKKTFNPSRLLNESHLLETKKLIKVQILLTNYFSLLFTILYIMGSYSEITSDVNNLLFTVILLSVTTLGLFLLLKEVLLFLTFNLNTLTLPSSYTLIHMLEKKVAKSEKKLPLFCFILCILCRIPFFLYSYPGIMTPDSINQFEQVIGMEPFSNHHPWIHTMIISFFYHLGSMFTGNKNLAFAFYTIFQIIFMALAASYLIYVLSKYTTSKLLLIFFSLFYALMPYHNVMALCIWKDVLFSGSVLIFSTVLFDLICIQYRKIKTDKRFTFQEEKLPLILYFISGILFCLLRSNGWYAFIITVPFLFVVFGKNKKIMVPINFLILTFVLLIKGPVMDHYQVKQPDFVESLSIPLQQIGRVLSKGYPIPEEDQQLIDQIIESQYVPELYTEYISDPMKELVRAGNPIYLENHKIDYFKLWLHLGLRYPGTYIEAYIQQTKGFYSPSTIYSVAEVDGIIDSDTGLTREYLLRGKIVVKVREILIKLQNILPIYGTFWSMGSLFWGILLFLYLQLSKNFYGRFLNLLKKGENETLPLPPLQTFTLWLPSIAIIMTLLLATPVAIEFRYAYHLAYCLPLYLGIYFSNNI